MITFRTLILTFVCMTLAAGMQMLGEYRDSLPYASDAKIYVTDIKLPLLPGPMCKTSGGTESESTVLDTAAL